MNTLVAPHPRHSKAWEESTGNQRCPQCGAAGRIVETGMEDETLNAVTGVWSIQECTDPACSMCWLDPMPTPQEIPAFYRGYHTHHPSASGAHRPSILRLLYERACRGYWANEFGYDPGKPAVLNRLLGRLLKFFPLRAAALSGSIGHVSARSNGSLLDVGCGRGDQLVRLRNLGWDVTGLEPDPEAARAARAQRLLVHEVHFNGVMRLPGRYDVVLLNQVIEHVPQPGHLLRACADALRPGGTLILTTPNARAWGRAHFGAHWRGWEVPRHLHLFTGEALSYQVIRAGLHVVSCKTIVGSPYTHRHSLALRHRRNHLTNMDRVVGLMLAWYHLARLNGYPQCGEYILLRAIRRADAREEVP